MAAKINWHRYGTKLRHCYPMCTVAVSLQPIKSWRWRAQPMNASCNWVDLLQISSVHVLCVNPPAPRVLQRLQRLYTEFTILKTDFYITDTSQQAFSRQRQTKEEWNNVNLYINTKNCSSSIVLTATDQKPQKSLKKWYYPPQHCLNVNVMLSNMTFLMIFLRFLIRRR